MKRLGLSNNQLKIIAMATMTVDHIGMILLPRFLILRMIGRIAFPIYAFMIAEGCRHTKSLPKYMLSLGILALICQAVAYAFTGALMLNVLGTFALSVGLIMLLKNACQKQTVLSWISFAAGVAAVFFLAQILPGWVPKTGFYVECDFIGVMLPVCVYGAASLPAQLCVSGVCLALLSSYSWKGQWFCLLALPLLALYNGQRGKWKLKWIFYFYYPVHLAVLWVLASML